MIKVRAGARPRRTVGLLGSLLATAALAAGLLAPNADAATAPVHNTCALSAVDVPACGVLWGAYVSGQNYAPLESEIGRQLDIVKNYVGWRATQATFPNAAAKALAGQGRVLEFSWSPQDFQTRAAVSYASIASGQWDKSVILPEAAALKTLPYKVIIDFSHEFDAPDHANLGTPAQYVAAYQHIYNVMAQAGVTNVIWAWVSTGYTARESQIASYYPGSAYVDWIGYDPYNFAECHSAQWNNAYNTFAPFYNWVQTQPAMAGKPLMLGEYGSAPKTNAELWYAQVPGAVHQLPLIKAVIQWDDGSSACDFRLDDSADALFGFTFAGTTSYILGH